MAAGSTSRLAGLRFVNPHRSADGGLATAHVTVAAGGGRPMPGDPGPLEVEIAGAGRLWSLAAWDAATHGTSLVVVDRGRLAHEWYADGVGRDRLLLGASMTKSVLAPLVGVAVGEGAPRLT